MLFDCLYTGVWCDLNGLTSFCLLADGYSSDDAGRIMVDAGRDVV
jgi:hypothetical protein